MAGVYSAGDFRNGTTFEMDGGVFRVVEFQHVKPGKGSAFVRTKLKNVITGAVIERTFNPSDKYPGSVYVTSNSTNIGGSTANTFPLNDNIVTSIFSFKYFKQSPKSSFDSGIWSYV